MRKLTLALAATTMALPVAMPAPAMAQSGYYQGKTWKGANGQTYCVRSNGTTGIIVGGAAGALAGRVVDSRGSRFTGTLLGAAAGALLGREIERNTGRNRYCR